MNHSSRGTASQHLSTLVTASLTVTPAGFLTAHPDITAWSTTDHDVYEHLTEIAAHQPAAPDVPPPTARPLPDAETALAQWEADEYTRIQAELDLAWASFRAADDSGVWGI